MFSPLVIELIGSNQYKLYTPLIYENSKLKITVFNGFVSDGASIPAALHSIIGCPFGELYTKAAIVHDILYRSGVFNRAMCDYLFFRMMIDSGVERAKARAMYLAVRAGGESSYLGMGSPAKFRDLIKIEIKE